MLTFVRVLDWLRLLHQIEIVVVGSDFSIASMED